MEPPICCSQAPMRPLPFVLLVGIALGCGGDDPAPSTDSGTTDVGSDVDAAADVVEDIVVDTSVPDVPEPDAEPAEPPTISSVRPNEGRLDDQQRIAILGRNFVGSCSVNFGENPATSVSIVNDQALDLRVPAGDEPGPVDVELTCAGGTATVEEGYTYTVEAEVLVTDYTPKVGQAVGGELVTFFGENFDAAERTLVRFGDDFATGVSVVDTNTITAFTPESTPGIATVSVEVGSQRVDMDEPFVFVEPLTVEDVSPFAVDRAGGTIVTITGTELFEFVGIEVFFGETAADPETFEYDEDGLILTLEAPSVDDLGLVDVTVTGLLASETIEEACAYVDPIFVDSMAPDAVPTTGVNRVTLSGERFDDALEVVQVFVGEVEAFDVSVDSTTEISFLVPPVEPGRHEVLLIHGFEEVVAPEELDVFAPITVSEISPDSGVEDGGTRVDIDGRGFVDGVIVRFGSELGTDIAVAGDGASLSVTTPPGSGVVDVTVQSPFSSGTLERAFTYEVDP